MMFLVPGHPSDSAQLDIRDTIIGTDMTSRYCNDKSTDQLVLLYTSPIKI
jgi:hypothetical protein